MATYLAFHEVDDVEHWLKSGKREEFFGPHGITVRTFRDPNGSGHWSASMTTWAPGTPLTTASARPSAFFTPDGRPVPEFLLHVDGDDAWWRWSDEPFTQTEVET